MLTPNYYRSQAEAFLALAREESSPEVKLLFLELAEGYQVRADSASELRLVSAADVRLVA
jgi:sirohydrochlorin ferrochelatase